MNHQFIQSSNIYELRPEAETGSRVLKIYLSYLLFNLFMRNNKLFACIFIYLN